jgi:hypothetical protein
LIPVNTERATQPVADHPSPAGLTIFWLEVLELAHSSKDSEVCDRLAQLAMRREDLDEVFGTGSSSRLWREYVRAFSSFSGAGAREIAQKIRERRYDDVEVVAQPIVFETTQPPVVVALGGGAVSGGGERPSGDCLRTNAPVYSVRLKRVDETDGIRIDTFVFLGGAWRTALKVGRK